MSKENTYHRNLVENLRSDIDDVDEALKERIHEIKSSLMDIEELIDERKEKEKLLHHNMNFNSPEEVGA